MSNPNPNPGNRLRGGADQVYRTQALRLATVDFFYMMTPDASASLLRIGGQKAAKLREHEAYRARWSQLERQHASDLEGALSEETRRLKRALAEMAPQAVEVLREHLGSKDKAARYKAALEVMDRDGRLGKVAKVQQQAPDKGELPAVSDHLLAELRVPDDRPN